MYGKVNLIYANITPSLDDELMISIELSRIQDKIWKVRLRDTEKAKQS